MVAKTIDIDKILAGKMGKRARLVPRTDWDKTTVSEGDNILIIKAVCAVPDW